MALLVAENLGALTASVIVMSKSRTLTTALQDTHCDLRRAGCADHQMRFVILENDRWTDRRKAGFSRRNRVCPVGARVEHRHAAVIKKTESIGNHSGWHSERVRHCHAISFPVYHR